MQLRHVQSSKEDVISYVARVSNPSNQNNEATAPKLLQYLIRHKHWSPFEHAFMTVEISTSRAIAAQILRHRSFVFQEFSQRYAEVSGYEYYEARRQDLKNRQNSIDDLSEEVKNWFTDAQNQISILSDSLYKTALKEGVSKEQARFLLPLSTKTTMYMTGNVRSWIHYLELRAGPETQLEHRHIANGIKVMFVESFPNTSKALGWGAQ